MRRRTWLSGAAATLAVLLHPTLRAQAGRQARRIGLVVASGEAFFAPTVRILHQAWAALGAQAGRDYVLLDRYADNDARRVPALTAELARQGAELIITTGPHTNEVLRASALPTVVMGLTDDALQIALADGNRHRLAGLTILAHELNLKRQELLAGCLPRGAFVLSLNSPNRRGQPETAAYLRAAENLGLKQHMAFVQSAAEIEAALAEAQRQGARAVHQMANQVLYAQRALIIECAHHARMATMLEWPEAARDGGVLGYGVDRQLMFTRLAELVWRILQGAKPGELPIEAPTHVRLAVNLRSAKAIGFVLPAEVLARAEEVIE